MSKKHREVFFAHNGTGPYSCFGCGEDIMFKDVYVHHDDENHSNNAPENLKPMHIGCHTTLHRTGKKHTVEAIAKMSQPRKGRSRSYPASHAEKISEFASTRQRNKGKFA